MGKEIHQFYHCKSRVLLTKSQDLHSDIEARLQSIKPPQGQSIILINGWNK